MSSSSLLSMCVASERLVLWLSIQVLEFSNFLWYGCISKCLIFLFKIKSYLSFQALPFPPSKLLFLISKNTLFTQKRNLFLESKHEIFQPSKHVFWKFKFLEKVESASATMTLASLAVQMGWIGSAGGTQPLRKAAREGSVSGSVTVKLQLDHRAALPIHLLRYPVSFKSDCYQMVWGEMWEIPSVWVVLPWVASLPYVVRDQLDMWKPVGIFASQNNWVLLTLDWIISSNEKSCNLMTCEEKYNFFLFLKVAECSVASSAGGNRR